MSLAQNAVKLEKAILSPIFRVYYDASCIIRFCMHYVKCKLRAELHLHFGRRKNLMGRLRCFPREISPICQTANITNCLHSPFLFCRDTEEWIQQQESVHGEQSNKSGAAEQHGQVRPFTAQYFFFLLPCGKRCPREWIEPSWYEAEKTRVPKTDAWSNL